MRLVIAGYYGFANAGDEAILAAMLADLRERLPAGGDHRRLRRSRGHHRRPRRSPPSCSRRSRALVDALRGADLLILGGGGLFQDYWGVETDTLLSPWHGGLSFFCGLPLLASLVDTPTMIYAAGVGPLLSDEGRLFTRYAFAQASAATVRDEASRAELAAAGADVVPASPSPPTPPPRPRGPARPPSRARLDAAARPLIGVALRAWDVGVDPERWEAEVAAAVDRVLAARGGTALFIPFQVLPAGGVDDVEVARRVRRRVKGNAIVAEGRLRAAETAALVAGCDAVVAMRLHAAVFAVAAGVPAAAIVYDPKVRSFVEDAGLAPYAGDIAACRRGRPRGADRTGPRRRGAPASGAAAACRGARGAGQGERGAGGGAARRRGAHRPRRPRDAIAMLRRAALGLLTGNAQRVAALAAAHSRRTWTSCGEKPGAARRTSSA